MLPAHRLHFLRTYYNITQKEMAKAIGKSDRWVRIIESGDQLPTEEVYNAWLKACYMAQKKK